MEFVIDESSKQSCINNIKNYVRLKDRYMAKTTQYYVLRTTNKYNHFFPILYYFFPQPLVCIIIEYVNDVFDINVLLKSRTVYYSDNDFYEITVQNSILNIKHQYYIKIHNSKIEIELFHMYYLMSIKMPVDAHEHRCFIDYYLKYYKPKKEQLIFDNCQYSKYHLKNQHKFDTVISRINNREHLDIEFAVITALYNNLYDVIL